MAGGRARDAIWKHYTEMRTIGKTGSRAECKQCKEHIQGIVSRLKTHHSECNKDNSVMEVDNLDHQDSSYESNNSTTEPIAIRRSLDSSISSLTKKPRTSADMNEFVVYTSKEKTEQLNMYLAEVIAACNIPFMFVDHPSFLKFCQAMRPGYKPPNRKKIASDYIPALYREQVKSVTDNLRGEPVTFSIDGWKNCKNEPLVCAVITTDRGETYLVSTIDTSGAPQTSQYLMQICELIDIFFLS